MRRQSPADRRSERSETERGTLRHRAVLLPRQHPQPRHSERSEESLLWFVLGVLDFPTVRYLRILRIFSAVAGPIPGTCCSSADVAVLMFTGCGGGFFVVAETATPRERQQRSAASAIRRLANRRGTRVI